MPLWAQWSFAIVGSVGTFLTSIALIASLRQLGQSRQEADVLRNQLQDGFANLVPQIAQTKA